MDNRVYIASCAARALEGLIQYIARAPLSQERIIMGESGEKIVYHSKVNPTLKRNFQVFDPLDWIAAITAHIPDKGQHMIRYYGFYSNVSRGKRREKGVAAGCPAIQEPLSSLSDYRRRWAQLIKKVYEVDPLICPKCGGQMKIVAFIQERHIIDQILTHLDLKEEHAHSPPKKEEAIEELTNEPVYDGSPFTEAEFGS